jgi:hypothetical protein
LNTVTQQLAAAPIELVDGIEVAIEIEQVI